MKEKDNFIMTINLRRVIQGRRPVRFRRSVKEIVNKVKRHFGAEKVILDPMLAKAISSNGYDKVKSRVTVNVVKIGEKTYLVRPVVKLE
ncbi:MAG: 50S ribosomal protein L31e [Sulfolobaceae archaeon]|nr:50S ribosomal protein L31e [Sulfolobaceae archaeon]